jgi:hypothetical protein
MDSRRDQETRDDLRRLAGNIGKAITERFPRGIALEVTIRNPHGANQFERNRLRALLQLMGMNTSRTKYFLKWFTNESLAIRQYVFSGLIEADGHLTRPGGRTPCAGFTQTIMGIVEGFHPLVRSLGLQYRVHIKGQRLDHRTGNFTQTSHIFNFANTNALAAALQFCKLPRKRICFLDIGDAHEAHLRFNIHDKGLDDGLVDPVELYNLLSGTPSLSTEKHQMVIAYDKKMVTKTMKKFLNFGLTYADMSLGLSFMAGTMRNYVLGLTYNQRAIEYMKNLLEERLWMPFLENITYAVQQQTRHRVVEIRLAE